ncbi:MarR family transcriptional regulator [Rhodococcus sp. 06-156-3C]|uniref:MarR family winged helix-turn-helix transcriptional regulator n=1 Tax=Nocardiaceae TaxID=85025 RepID=UPI00052302B1|nr:MULTISPECIES: MarR family transcriptional regulator [Rhodococcus]OZD13107.1 MarR family transcriptional regulator [Rhodococcus sp. 06-156-4a]OZD17976.1 MarR family transcriptional regulator [Rhodococcus sp. 06-156-3C]OZD20700.1 MarR family transcriptional regulator [Rhodococcus sp. 06-156-4C]OZD30581.1 MarR family transcriptional regulator [Rhodococcus sp. 06-156-3b]OZD32646.1 MarR family transcriptional regulator [Rhodococcus sp. 06-156-3]
MQDRVDQLREDIVVFNRMIRSKGENHLLSPTQLQALAHLDRVGPMSARSLADLERVTPQTVARTVAALEGDQLVSRTVDPDDGRAHVISISDRGRGKLDAERGKRRQWLAAVLAEECTDVEQELLFLAGSVLRRLAESRRGRGVETR